MKWENELLKYLQNANAELQMKRQYYFRIKQMFDYLFKLIYQRKIMEANIKLLEKLNVSSNRYCQKLNDIDDNIKQIRKELNMS